MLTRNHRQEALSRAYVQIVAAMCGLSWSSRENDYGIDMTLHEVEADGSRLSESGFGIDLQVKSTSVPRWTANDLLFDLPVANYNDLRKEGLIRQRLLVVLALPDDEMKWVSVSDDQLFLRHAAYWYSVAGGPQTRNRKTVSVAIPRARLFSPSAFLTLIAKLKRGERP